MCNKELRRSERGATLVEFAIAGAVFLTAMFGVFEMARLLWTHNELTNATKRGARYAVLHRDDDIDKVKNIVVCGIEASCSQSVISGLTTNNVEVIYSIPYFSNMGTVTVRIDPNNPYQFNFVVPLIGTTLTMPSYSTTLGAESAGEIPEDVPAG